MAFLQSPAPRQPIFHAPAIVLGLIGAFVLAHGARLLASAERQAAILNDYGFTPARYSAAFLAAHHVDPGAWWEQALPFVSYMALHGSWTHVGANCLWLFAFGPVVARRFGTSLFLLFFLVCGVAGAGAYLALNWGSPDGMIGCSGAVSGLMAAGVRLLPGQSPWARPDEASLAPLFSRQVLMFSLLWLATNLVLGLTGWGMEAGVQLAWQAHLGGYVAGLLLAGAFDAVRPRQKAHTL